MAALIRPISCSALRNLPFGATHNDEFKVTTTWDASARLRAGMAAQPVADALCDRWPCLGPPPGALRLFDRVDRERLELRPGQLLRRTLGPDVITHSATKLGWTAGAGAEMLLEVELGGARAISLRRLRVSVVRTLHSLQLFGHQDLYRVCRREQPAVRLV